MSERDRRLQQRDEERRNRRMQTGLNVVANHVHTTLDQRSQERDQYEQQLKQLRQAQHIQTMQTVGSSENISPTRNEDATRSHNHVDDSFAKVREEKNRREQMWEEKRREFKAQRSGATVNSSVTYPNSGIALPLHNNFLATQQNQPWSLPTAVAPPQNPLLPSQMQRTPNNASSNTFPGPVIQPTQHPIAHPMPLPQQYQVLNSNDVAHSSFPNTETTFSPRPNYHTPVPDSATSQNDAASTKPGQYLSKREYAQELEKQMKMKQTMAHQDRDRIAVNHSFGVSTAPTRAASTNKLSQQEYAQELRNQMAHQQSSKESELNDTNNYRTSNANVLHPMASHSAKMTPHEYARQLQMQIDYKKTIKPSMPSQSVEVDDMGVSHAPGSPKNPHLLTPEQYARELKMQIQHNKEKENNAKFRPVDVVGPDYSNQQRQKAGTLSKDQYAQELQNQIAMKQYLKQQDNASSSHRSNGAYMNYNQKDPVQPQLPYSHHPSNYAGHHVDSFSSSPPSFPPNVAFGSPVGFPNSRNATTQPPPDIHQVERQQARQKQLDYQRELDEQKRVRDEARRMETRKNEIEDLKYAQHPQHNQLQQPHQLLHQPQTQHQQLHQQQHQQLHQLYEYQQQQPVHQSEHQSGQHPVQHEERGWWGGHPQPLGVPAAYSMPTTGGAPPGYNAPPPSLLGSPLPQPPPRVRGRGLSPSTTTIRNEGAITHGTFDTHSNATPLHQSPTSVGPPPPGRGGLLASTTFPLPSQPLLLQEQRGQGVSDGAAPGGFSSTPHGNKPGGPPSPPLSPNRRRIRTDLHYDLDEHQANSKKQQQIDMNAFLRNQMIQKEFREKELKRQREAEELAEIRRIEEEQAKIRLAYEEEQREKKRKAEHQEQQDFLHRQMLDKKKRDEELKRRDKEEEEREEFRIRQEREEMKAKEATRLHQQQVTSQSELEKDADPTRPGQGRHGLVHSRKGVRGGNPDVATVSTETTSDERMNQVPMERRKEDLFSPLPPNNGQQPFLSTAATQQHIAAVPPSATAFPHYSQYLNHPAAAPLANVELGGSAYQYGMSAPHPLPMQPTPSTIYAAPPFMHPSGNTTASPFGLERDVLQQAISVQTMLVEQIREEIQRAAHLRDDTAKEVHELKLEFQRELIRREMEHAKEIEHVKYITAETSRRPLDTHTQPNVLEYDFITDAPPQTPSYHELPFQPSKTRRKNVIESSMQGGLQCESLLIFPSGKEMEDQSTGDLRPEVDEDKEEATIPQNQNRHKVPPLQLEAVLQDEDFSYLNQRTTFMPQKQNKLNSPSRTVPVSASVAEIFQKPMSQRQVFDVEEEMVQDEEVNRTEEELYSSPLKMQRPKDTPTKLIKSSLQSPIMTQHNPSKGRTLGSSNQLGEEVVTSEDSSSAALKMDALTSIVHRISKSKPNLRYSSASSTEKPEKLDSKFLTLPMKDVNVMDTLDIDDICRKNENRLKLLDNFSTDVGQGPDELDEFVQEFKNLHQIKSLEMNLEGTSRWL